LHPVEHSRRRYRRLVGVAGHPGYL
jgi:hypothetical protein